MSHEGGSDLLGGLCDPSLRAKKCTPRGPLLCRGLWQVSLAGIRSRYDLFRSVEFEALGVLDESVLLYSGLVMGLDIWIQDEFAIFLQVNSPTSD